MHTIDMQDGLLYNCSTKGWRWQDNSDRRQFMHQHL